MDGEKITRRAAPEESIARMVGLNLAVAYAVAIIVTTYLSPPNDLPVLIVGPLVLVVISAIFGLAAVYVARVVRLRFNTRLVWLVTTWISLILSLVDPFLPSAPSDRDRTQAPAEFRTRMR
jgi:hypothetical protein